MNRRLWLTALLSAMFLLVTGLSISMAAHPTGNWTSAQISKILNSGKYWDGSGTGPTAGVTPIEVVLKDRSGNDILVLTNAKAYSPKQTCGKCHKYENVNAGGAYDLSGTSISKTQRIDGVPHSYSVKAATTGVTSGYHFSQGMNEPWDDNWRGYFSLPEFTSSPGMIGKF